MTDDGETIKQPLGCLHYKRKCQLVAPCCQRVYTCRFCHNEKEDHEINRKEVQDVVCLICRTQQKVTGSCTSCKTVFGNYFCEVCRLFDDEDKKQFHCDQCGICRVGGRDNFFHCPKCDLCLPKKLRDKHKCVEKASQANCPVCLEDLHSSIVPSHVPPCSHLIHRTCFEDMLSNGHYTCPVCSISMVNMKPVWEKLDEEMAATAMPVEYADVKVDILCRDCHKESLVFFHVIGLKCTYCGSYNTCRSGGTHHTHSENDETEDDDDNDDVDDDNADPSQLDCPPPPPPPDNETVCH